MITSPAPGVRQIVAPPSARAHSRIHDPWPDHAVAFVGRDVVELAGVGWIHRFEFVLRDMAHYGYYSQGFPTAQAALDQYIAEGDYVSPFGRKGDFGMWFNFVVRPTLKHKFAL